MSGSSEDIEDWLGDLLGASTAASKKIIFDCDLLQIFSSQICSFK